VTSISTRSPRVSSSTTRASAAASTAIRHSNFCRLLRHPPHEARAHRTGLVLFSRRCLWLARAHSRCRCACP
jgi:hypothetical protein